MRHELSIDRVPLLNYGVWFDGAKVFNNAEPDVETVEVPGRNGNLIFDNRRFKNVQIDYEAIVNQKFRERYLDFRSFLFSERGYRRIEDSHIPNVYRMGRVMNNVDPSFISWSHNVAMFTLSLDCRPELFLTSGEQSLEISRGISKIINPTRFTAKPLIRVYFSSRAVLKINGERIELTQDSSVQPYIDLDCDAQEAFYNLKNCNYLITLEEDHFPDLWPGENEVETTADRLEVIPRWWTI